MRIHYGYLQTQLILAIDAIRQSCTNPKEIARISQQLKAVKIPDEDYLNVGKFMAILLNKRPELAYSSQFQLIQQIWEYCINQYEKKEDILRHRL